MPPVVVKTMRPVDVPLQVTESTRWLVTVKLQFSGLITTVFSLVQPFESVTIYV